ncbi:hypothetical protein KFK09_006576 [Dendrobium nobile]|uniref:Uncharacterized protein n=1 Tax=Dendrobium nobile TaxID=94219 RepID=A0A8T3BST0_DENNO|nr:hypothetical protein KFK09_006576 [Dendrobium nobile]
MVAGSGYNGGCWWWSVAGGGSGGKTGAIGYRVVTAMSGAGRSAPARIARRVFSLSRSVISSCFVLSISEGKLEFLLFARGFVWRFGYEISEWLSRGGSSFLRRLFEDHSLGPPIQLSYMVGKFAARTVYWMTAFSSFSLAYRVPYPLVIQMLLHSVPRLPY